MLARTTILQFMLLLLLTPSCSENILGALVIAYIWRKATPPEIRAKSRTQFRVWFFLALEVKQFTKGGLNERPCDGPAL